MGFEKTENTRKSRNTSLLRKTALAAALIMPLSLSTTNALGIDTPLKTPPKHSEISKNLKEVPDKKATEDHIIPELKTLPICNNRLKEGVYHGKLFILTVKNSEAEITNKTTGDTYKIENVVVDVALYDVRHGAYVAVGSYLAFRAEGGLLLVRADVLYGNSSSGDTLFLSTKDSAKDRK